MAINFLNDIDLNQNEAFHLVLENQANDTAAGTPVDGQMYYDTGTNAVKVGEGGVWVALAASSGAGSVTSVGIDVGTGISVSMNSGSNPITGAGEFLLTNTGVTSIVAGSNISISGATGAVTISSTDTTYSTMTSTTLGLGKLFSDTEQTETAEPVTSTTDRTYGIQMNSSDQLVVNVPWTDTTGAVTSVDEKAAGTSTGTPIVVDPTTGAVEVQSMAYAGTTNVGHVPTGGGATTFLRGDGTWVTPTDTDTGVTGVTLATGTSVGAPLTESIATRELTLTSMAYDGGTNIGYVPTGGSGSTFLRGDGTWVTPTNTNHTYSLSVGAVSSNESTLTLVGAGGGSDSTAKFSGTTNEIEITTPSTGDGGDVTIGLPAAVTIATSLAISGSGAAALDISAGKAQTAATAASDPDATLTTKGYVDGLVSGGLNFKGTFRADTGLILGGGSTYIYQLTGSAFDPSATRVEVEVGDYYVVATAGGDFYGDGGTGTCSPTRPLTVGDSIIGLTAASATASTCANWSIVESNEGVTTFTNTNGTYVSASTVNSGATGAVTVGTIDLSAVDGTATNTVRFLDKNNKWSVPAYTTNTDETYDLNVSDDGDNVDLNLTSTSGTDNSTVQLTAGTGITLTPTGSTEVTIATTGLDNYQYWTLAGDSGSGQEIASTNTATFAGGTKITTADSATDTLTISHATQSQTNTTPSSTLTSGGTFTALSANVTVDSTGHVTGQALETYTLPTSDNYSSWTLAGDSGTPQSIGSTDTATIAGGTGISTVAGSTDTVTVSLDSGSTGAWSGNLSGSTSGISNGTPGSGGYTTFTLTTATLFGTTTDSRQVLVEVMQIADNDPSASTPAYSTVYPSVARAAATTIEIKFKGTIADDKYYAILSHAGNNS